MQRCATCRHWDSLDYPRANTVYLWDEGEREVDVGQNERPWGVCDAPSGPEHVGHSRLMQVWDASSYHASLRTRDTFGCVEHSPLG